MKLILSVFILIMSIPVHSEIISLEVVPEAWKLENYINDNVVVWYAGSSCVNGRLLLPGNASLDDKNRLWSVIMAAKVSSKKVFVRYDNSTSSCFIESFGMYN